MVNVSSFDPAANKTSYALQDTEYWIGANSA
jgi:hypothetical protein